MTAQEVKAAVIIDAIGRAEEEMIIVDHCYV